MDDDRPGSAEETLVDWAKPFLSESRRVLRIMDTRLGGQYSKKGVQAAAALALKCLHTDPKNRPPMVDVLASLERLQTSSNSPRTPQRSSHCPRTPQGTPDHHRDHHRDRVKPLSHSRQTAIEVTKFSMTFVPGMQVHLFFCYVKQFCRRLVTHTCNLSVPTVLVSSCDRLIIPCI